MPVLDQLTKSNLSLDGTRGFADRKFEFTLMLMLLKTQQQGHQEVLYLKYTNLQLTRNTQIKDQ